MSENYWKTCGSYTDIKYVKSEEECLYKWKGGECVEYKYPIMHDKGAVGGLLKGFFGYNGDPSLIEFVTWILSICCLLFLWRNSNRGGSND